jgi:methylmalonyl-CoA/ethylmalonyl-CoA epimerase
VGIVVPNLDAAMQLFRERFGLAVTEPVEAPAQKVRIAYVEFENACVELLAPTTEDSPIAKFLRRHPEGGLHHIAFGVADAEDAAAAVISHGLGILGSGAPTQGHHGRLLFFVDPKSMLGALTEIEQLPQSGERPYSHTPINVDI